MPEAPYWEFTESSIRSVERGGNRVVQPTSGRRVPVYGTGRQCEQKGCDTLLSIYNSDGLCYWHRSRCVDPPRKKAAPKASDN